MSDKNKTKEELITEKRQAEEVLAESERKYRQLFESVSDAIMIFDSQTTRILVVEDEEAVLSFASRLLEQNGYIVFKARDAKEAIDIFERERGDIHLLLADVVLPDSSGLDLAEQLVGQKARLAVLLSSGYTGKKAQWSLICEKGFPFIQKPYSSVALLEEVRRAIR